MVEENVRAALAVAASAARVFAVLVDPAAHSPIGGTGWVQEAADHGAAHQGGADFRMDMYHSAIQTVTTRWPTRGRCSTCRAPSAARNGEERRPPGSSAAGPGVTTLRCSARPLLTSRSPTTGQRGAAVHPGVHPVPPFGPEHLAQIRHLFTLQCFAF